jgi:hypothetical protein
MRIDCNCVAKCAAFPSLLFFRLVVSIAFSCKNIQTYLEQRRVIAVVRVASCTRSKSTHSLPKRKMPL